MKKGIIFKIATFVFFVFDGTQPQDLSPGLYIYDPRPVRSSLNKNSFSFSLKKSCARWKLKGFGRSLYRLPLSGTTFLLTSDTAVLSHSSKLLAKLFSSLQPTLSYSNPFTRTELILILLLTDLFFYSFYFLYKDIPRILRFS